MRLSDVGFRLATPVLHRMDAEAAHRATIAALRLMPPGLKPAPNALLGQKILGLDFPNPLGLAPGFDKNAEVPDAMLGLGFGFVEVGTVTPKPQAGNPRPRLFRLAEDGAVINRMGFNNDGQAAVLNRLELRRTRGGIVGVNIGANKDSDDRIGDYVSGLTAFASVASYITVNISSPNTPGLRNLQNRDDLARLLERLNAARPQGLSLWLKIAPDLADDDLADVAALCSGGAVDAVVISNTTLGREHLLSPLARESGGLSGKPLFDLSTRKLSTFYRLSGGKIPLVGVGGIHDAETAYAKIKAGAHLIQLYSALVYQGPALILRITDGLASRLKADGLATVANAVGTHLAL